MSILKEFREFAIKGNVADLAVGVVIGAAFGRVVTSLVSDLMMPPLGVLIGGVNFSHLSLVLREQGADGKPVALNYGAFLQVILDFLLVAIAVFIAVKIINRLRRREEQKPAPQAVPALAREIELLTEIRDALRR